MSRLCVGLVLATLAIALPASAAPPPTKSPGELLVGLNLGEPGFQVGAVQGTKVVLARGFEIDLARLLARKLELERVRFVHEPAFRKLYAPGAKEWDIALAQVTITPTRAKAVSFSRPYLTADQGVLLAEGVAAPKRLGELRPLQLCAQRGTTSAATIAERVRPKRKPILFEKQEGLLDALYQRRCDAVVNDAPLLAAFRAAAPDRYGQLIGRLGVDAGYGVVVEKGSPLTKRVSRALAELEREGKTPFLVKRWLDVDVSKLPVLG